MLTALWPWLRANASWLAPLAVVLLSSLATGLTRYPRAGGAVYWLRWLAGVLSVLAHRDVAGVFSLPLVPQRRPGDAPPADPPLPLAPALLLLALLPLAGCGGWWSAIKQGGDTMAGDLGAVVPQAARDAEIEFGRSLSRRLLMRSCQESWRRGDPLPHPDCAGLVPALVPAAVAVPPVAPASAPVR